MYRAKPSVITVNGEKWYSAQGVAKVLKVHLSRAHELMRTGALTTTRDIDRITRASETSIDQYKQRRRVWLGLHGRGPRVRRADALV